jgi:methionine sulfoxide reductase catalytic subunit
MKLFKSGIPTSQITPESVYLSRRALMKAGVFGLSAAALAACGGSPSTPTTVPATAAPNAVSAPVDKAAQGLAPATTTNPAEKRDEAGDLANTYEQISTYNNFYEFSTDKEAVAAAAAGFKTDGWQVQVGGLVNRPMTFDLDSLRKAFGEEERIYRLRCVEGWSMVIPWQGFALNKLLKMVEPKAEAKFVRFETLTDTKRLPGTTEPYYTWPYVEGLRLDEGMNDLTLLATGLYGKPMPPQNGAPIRLAVPWKYGFKSIKSIVKIDLVDAQPTSLWMAANGAEYGFYSNVNPQKSHPRWSQASERRIGDGSRRRTQMFNGYEKQVTALYAGMDLNENY